MTAQIQSQSSFIDKEDTMLLLVDCQPGLSLAAESRSHQQLVDNIVALVRTATVFGIPIVSTTSATQRFSGPVWPAITNLLPTAPMERHALNADDDPNVRQAMEATGRKTMVIAGLLTEACVSFPALSLSARGF